MSALDPTSIYVLIALPLIFHKKIQKPNGLMCVFHDNEWHPSGPKNKPFDPKVVTTLPARFCQAMDPKATSDIS
jgi:hypothetical protein